MAFQPQETAAAFTWLLPTPSAVSIAIYSNTTSRLRKIKNQPPQEAEPHSTWLSANIHPK
jgi:hypothetical protein